jgi:hypothetical protein
MPQSVRRLLLALVAVFVATVALPRPALAQSAPDNGVGPAFPVLMQSVSFADEADSQPALAQSGTQAPPPQKKHHEGIGIGFKGGPAFSNISTNGAVNFSHGTGYQLSLFLGGNRPGVFGVATEITFIKRNANAQGLTTTSAAGTALEIPLLFRFNFGSRNLSGVCFYFMLGPAIDINLEKFGVAELVKNSGYDVNLIFSGGVEITRFIIEFRFNKGLKNLAPDLTPGADVKTHAYVILFGVRFN